MSDDMLAIRSNATMQRKTFGFFYQNLYQIRFMETLLINIPETKSDLVKMLLTELGVTYEEKKFEMTSFKEEVLKISVWEEKDFQYIELATKNFNSLEPAK